MSQPAYDQGMPMIHSIEVPDRMTWDELDTLPEEIAGEIELWDGQVVWMHRAPGEHSDAMAVLWRELARCWNEAKSDDPEPCLKVRLECNVFLGASGKNDFVTPDFLIHRCVGKFADIRASDTLLVGEVLSKSNTPSIVATKKDRYAAAGIRWYWEVALSEQTGQIATVRAYVLEEGHGILPEGIHPLQNSNYILVGEWLNGRDDGIVIDHPFPIRIPWDALEL